MLFFFRQCAKVSTSSLLANKIRSFLTMLGIIIGVGSVIVIMSVGAGAQSLVLSQIKSLGSDLVGVMPGKSEENSPPASVMGIVITSLKYEDALALKKEKNAPNLVEVAAYARGVGTLSWGANTYDTDINGTTSGYLKVEGGEIEKGRFFTEEEERNLSRVVVLGSLVAEELFGQSDPIGRRIKIKKHGFEVIGVMKERGRVAFQNYDDQVFIPIKTAQKIILGINYVNIIRAKIDNEENIERAISDIEATLRERHDIDDLSGDSDDFTVQSLAQALDTITSITDGLRFFLTAMAALSLIVGGIGIMNIMLIRVTERTREIGLRKAIGAKNMDIMSQFLVEALTVTLLGGLIGIIGGIILSFIISVAANLLGYSWDFIISFLSIVMAISVSMIVGLLFGVYPALKASKLDPVEALRYE